MGSFGFFSVTSSPAGTIPVVVGHRGDPARHPENTLAGVSSALRSVGAAEIDIRWTADGRLILSHDPRIDGRLIAEHSWEDLDGVAAAGGRRLCMLDEVMVLPGRLDLEVKNFPIEPSFDSHHRLVGLVAARARPDDIVTSFYWPDVDWVRSHAPDVATGLLVDEGWPPQPALDHASTVGHAGIFLHHSLVDRHICRRAREAGIAVATWTVNDISRARELAQLGVEAIISDEPSLILEAFGEEGL